MYFKGGRSIYVDKNGEWFESIFGVPMLVFFNCVPSLNFSMNSSMVLISTYKNFEMLWIKL
ncbi:hypothetical protein MOUN0_L06832 [Monosporozyma unispora]